MAKRITLDFLRTESASGMILASAALLAIILANSPWADAYFGFIGAKFTIQIGGFVETHSVLDWIKEGLMAIFFFVVGLEIKHEVVKGELANPRRAGAAGAGGVGGMAIPAAVYVAFNLGAGGMPQAGPSRSPPTSPSRSPPWRSRDPACRRPCGSSC